MTATATIASAAAELYELAAGRQLDEHERPLLEAMFACAADGRWLEPRFGPVSPAVLEARALAGLFLLEENAIWSVWRPASRAPAFRRVRHLAEAADPQREVLGRIRAANGEERIWTKRGRWLTFVARANHGGRGYSADCYLMDDCLNGDLIEALPNLAGSTNPQFVTCVAPIEQF